MGGGADVPVCAPAPAAPAALLLEAMPLEVAFVFEEFAFFSGVRADGAEGLRAAAIIILNAFDCGGLLGVVCASLCCPLDDGPLCVLSPTTSTSSDNGGEDGTTDCGAAGFASCWPVSSWGGAAERMEPAS